MAIFQQFLRSLSRLLTGSVAAGQSPVYSGTGTVWTAAGPFMPTGGGTFAGDVNFGDHTLTLNGVGITSWPVGLVSSVTAANGLSLTGGVLAFSGAAYDAAGAASAVAAASLPRAGCSYTGDFDFNLSGEFAVNAVAGVGMQLGNRSGRYEIFLGSSVEVYADLFVGGSTRLQSNPLVFDSVAYLGSTDGTGDLAWHGTSLSFQLPASFNNPLYLTGSSLIDLNGISGKITYANADAATSPFNATTARAWQKVRVNGQDFWYPLYQ